MVVLRYLMLLFDLSGVFAASSPMRRAFLLAKIPLSVVLPQSLSFQERWLRNVCFANLPLSEAKQVCRRRGLIHQTPNEIPRSWASHSLAFFRLSRSKKGSAARRLLTYHLISPISRRSAQDDLLKWGEVRDFTLTGCRGRQPLPICARLIFLIVGATSGRPRAFKERPYGFGCRP